MKEHPQIPGLFTYDDILSKEEEEALVKSLQLNDWEEVISRRCQQFGHYYNQHKKWIEKKFTPFPPYVQFLIERLKQLEIMPYHQNESMWLVQEYMPGQMLYAHIDQFGDIVIGINLLASTDMQFVNPNTKEQLTVELKRRGLYVLSGDARYVWKHGLNNITKRRMSITIRNLIVNEAKLKK